MKQIYAQFLCGLFFQLIPPGYIVEVWKWGCGTGNAELRVCPSKKYSEPIFKLHSTSASRSAAT